MKQQSQDVEQKKSWIENVFETIFFLVLFSVYFYYFKHTFIWEKGRLINIHNFSNHFVIIYASSGFTFKKKNVEMRPNAANCINFKNEALNIYTIKLLHRTEELFLLFSNNSLSLSLLQIFFTFLCLWIFQLYNCVGFAYVMHNFLYMYIYRRDYTAIYVGNLLHDGWNGEIA